MKVWSPGRMLLALLVCLLITVLLAGCGAPAPTATPVPPAPTKAPAAPTAVPPTAAPTKPAATPAPARPAVDQASIQKAWESGPHNNKYDLYHGPNTYCARCHSPQNWDPKATVGTAPNCFSCKFPTDKEVRISPKAPLIAEADWKKVNCSVCHEVKSGVTDGKLVVWNNGAQKYDSVTSTTDLCEKCHVDSLGGTMHKVKLGGGAHSNQIGQGKQRPEACTDCHDPHSAKADCKTCHAASFPPSNTTNQGHSAVHAKVTCVGCHNANTALVPRRVEATGMVTSGEVAKSRAGVETFTPIYSHIFKKAVVCTDCHFDNNPLKLRSMVTPTAVPTARPAASGTPTAGAAPKPSPSPSK